LIQLGVEMSQPLIAIFLEISGPEWDASLINDLKWQLIVGLVISRATGLVGERGIRGRYEL
jgi:hypothetical protein